MSLDQSDTITALFTFPKDDYLTEVQVARLLGISKQSVSEAVKDGRLRSARLLTGKHEVRILRVDALSYKLRYKVRRYAPGQAPHLQSGSHGQSQP